MIDIIFFFLVLLAVVKGYSNGFIRAVFSVIALVIGLAAAMKLSVMAATYLQRSIAVPSRWLPVISFALVFTAVVILIRMASGLLQKAAEAVTLGWLNKLAGILLYIVLYTIIFSVALFYAEKIHLLSSEALAASRTYPRIQPVGPAVINSIGYVIPVLKTCSASWKCFWKNRSLACSYPFNYTNMAANEISHAIIHLLCKGKDIAPKKVFAANQLF